MVPRTCSSSHDPCWRPEDPAPSRLQGALCGVQVKYADVPKCVALVCPRPSDPLGKIGRCKNQWGQKCEIDCQRGFASGGKWSRAGQPIVFTCEDVNRTGVFQTDWEPCAELSPAEAVCFRVGASLELAEAGSKFAR